MNSKLIEVLKQNKKIVSVYARNVRISRKKTVNLMRYLKYLDLNRAKRYLEEIIELKRAVPFYKYNRDLPHKKNIDNDQKVKQGRYPVKPAKAILKFLNILESNAKNLGLDPNKIILLPSIIEKSYDLPARLNKIEKAARGPVRGHTINIRIYGLYVESLDPTKKYKRKELKALAENILKEWSQKL